MHSVTAFEGLGEQTMEQWFLGDMYASRTEFMGHSSRDVVRDGRSYSIDDAKREIYVMDLSYDWDEAYDWLSQAAPTYNGSGRAEFFGETHHYDEYASETSRIRYFLDGSRLVGIQLLPDGGSSISIKILALESPVTDRSVFDIPSGYTIIEI